MFFLDFKLTVVFL